MAKYRKYLVALGGFALTLGLALADAGQLGKWGAVVVAFATAIGVRQVPNEIPPKEIPIKIIKPPYEAPDGPHLV